MIFSKEGLSLFKQLRYICLSEKETMLANEGSNSVTLVSKQPKLYYSQQIKRLSRFNLTEFCI